MFAELIVFLVILFTVVALYRELFHPVIIFLLSVSFLLFLGILSPKDVLSGFSNEQIVDVVLLILVSKLLQSTGVLSFFISKVLKENLGYKDFLARMMAFVSSISTVINNTPVVAMVLPYVNDWCHKKKIPPSKLLIPLSYASIFGGMATLIGTSTNLVVNALTVESGLKPFSFFDFSYVGVPAMILGFLYLYFVGYKLLPERPDIIESFLSRRKDYLVETVIKPDSPLVGKTVKQANLRNLEGLYLAEIVRRNKRIYPVSPSEILQEEDILIFVGDTRAVVNLVQNNYGLSLPKFCSLDSDYKELVEVVISNNSSLINKKIRETNFRARFDAAVLAVHRNGERLKGKIGEIVLKPGDLLLLIVGKDFWKKVEDITDFYIVSRLDKVPDEKEFFKGKVLFLIFLFVILLSAFKIVPLFTALIFVLLLAVLFKITDYSRLKSKLDINFFLIAVLSLALGRALVKTGLAETFAQGISSLLGGLGLFGYILGIYLITNVLTEFVNNVAAASIAFPIALASAGVAGVDPKYLILAVAYGASASFVTPIGYQTNLMVFAVGNYKFRDFLKVGLPLSVLMCILCTTILTFLAGKGGI